jgi:probable F420-dependent oxidoreductase
LKVGVGFFVTGYTIDAVTFARAAEAAGFESVWVPDHPVLPTHIRTPGWGGERGEALPLLGEMADPFVLLAFIAAVTTRIRLGTGVALIAQRHPLSLAKTVATLDNFSGGRVELGVGASGLREDVELYGVDYATRWRHADEVILAAKALWEHGTAAFEGEFVRFPEVRCDPLPVQRPHPPVIIGAVPGERTFRRIARVGDGWLPVMPSPAEVAHGRREIERWCRETGRDASRIEISVFGMDVTPETQRIYEEAGAQRLVIGIYNHPGTPLPYERWHEMRRAALGGPRPPAAETLRVLHAAAEQARF